MYWNDYNYLLEELFALMPGILEASDLEFELYYVFSRHNSKFSDEMKNKIKALINNVPGYYLRYGENHACRWQFQWLSALKNNEYFISLYEKTKAKAAPRGGKDYAPGEFIFRDISVEDNSPLSREQVANMPVAEIIKYLNKFQGVDSWHGIFARKPTREGLAVVLQYAVKDSPVKFVDALKQFIDIDDLYLHRIIHGIHDSWNDGGGMDWERYFDFCVACLEVAPGQGKDDDKSLVIRAMVEFIDDIFRKDELALDVKYFDQVEKIFDLIVPLLKGETCPDVRNDALTYALNTTLGMTVRNYLYFSLTVARMTDKKIENWGNDKFERFLPVGIEGYIWLGSWLSQVYYSDTGYAKAKIDYFSRQNISDFQWQMFMEGYLTNRQVYEGIYIPMRENYKKCVSCDVFNGRVDRDLVGHICVGYLNMWESLDKKNDNGDESLFWKLLMEPGNSDNFDRWIEAATFFRSVVRTRRNSEDGPGGKGFTEEHKNRILEFWRWTYANQEFVKDKLKGKYGNFLGQMAELTIILDKIGEEEEKWLILCASHIEYGKPNFLIEYLARYDDSESISRVGRIFNRYLKNATPTHRQEYIKSIVKRIYTNGNKDDADAICSTYGRRGIDFLKPVWDEFHGE